MSNPKTFNLKPLSEILGKTAKRIHDREKGIYRLTAEEASEIEVALRLRIEACLENGDEEGAAKWRKIWRKFK